MNNFELEKEELSLIYEEKYKLIEKNIISINVNSEGRSAKLTFTVPLDYPEKTPNIIAEIEGQHNEQLEQHLNKIATTMIGISMISYIVGYAFSFLTGLPEKEFRAFKEHVTQTPFSRENFLLWLEKWNAEHYFKVDENQPLTGRQLFERGMAS